MTPTVQYVSSDDDVDRESLADDLVALFETYGWWADRDRSEVRAALAGTDELVVLRDEGTPVAAARVLTDYVYYAQVYDVVVHGDRRGEGLGRELMTAVVEHPRLRDVSPSLLAREGVVEFYELPVRTGVAVEALRRHDYGFVLHTSAGVIHSRFVVWAAGQFGHPNDRPFPGA